MTSRILFVVATFLLQLPLGQTHAQAQSNQPIQHNMQRGSGHSGHNMKAPEQALPAVKPAAAAAKAAAAKIMPIEPGQGAFATIAEIVVILNNDPTTDWSKVNITRLREHLIDMDEVALRATATTAVFADRIVFTITGTGRTLKAIQAMVPPHSGVLTRTTTWDVKSELTQDGAIMSVTSKNSNDLTVVNGLGFFGVMATGAHHQAHHLAMARGDALSHAHH